MQFARADETLKRLRQSRFDNSRDAVLLAQSAVDRFRNAAYDFVVEGESYRSRLKPTIDAADPPPASPAMKTKIHPRARSRLRR